MSAKECFVICPIGADGSDIRKRCEQVFKYVISPPVTECGYTPVRADQMPNPGMITGQIIEHLINAPLVVADLTGDNANVFYELAIRHAFRKPLVQLIQTGDRIPFDVAGMRTIHVDHQNLDSVDEAKLAIKEQIQAMDANRSDIVTPISSAIDLQALRSSSNPVDQSQAKMLAGIEEIRSRLSRLEHDLLMQKEDFVGKLLSLRSKNVVRDKWLDYVAKVYLQSGRTPEDISTDDLLKHADALLSANQLHREDHEKSP